MAPIKTTLYAVALALLLHVSPAATSPTDHIFDSSSSQSRRDLTSQYPILKSGANVDGTSEALLFEQNLAIQHHRDHTVPRPIDGVRSFADHVVGRQHFVKVPKLRSARPAAPQDDDRTARTRRVAVQSSERGVEGWYNMRTGRLVRRNERRKARRGHVPR